MPELETLTTKRDELVGESNFLNRRVSDLRAELVVLGENKDALLMDIEELKIVRDQLINSELEKIKEIFTRINA